MTCDGYPGARSMPSVVTIGGSVVVTALVLVAAAWLVSAIGHGYVRLSLARQSQLRGATLYHYCDDSIVEDIYNLAEGVLTLEARGRAFVPFITGRRAVFFYVGHGPRGGRFNHPASWRSRAAVLRVSGDQVLRQAGSVGALRYRRWDGALALLGDYHGPALLCARNVDVIAVKNTAAAPSALVHPKARPPGKSEEHPSNVRPAGPSGPGR